MLKCLGQACWSENDMFGTLTFEWFLLGGLCRVLFVRMVRPVLSLNFQGWPKNPVEL